MFVTEYGIVCAFSTKKNIQKTLRRRTCTCFINQIAFCEVRGQRKSERKSIQKTDVSQGLVR